MHKYLIAEWIANVAEPTVHHFEGTEDGLADIVLGLITEYTVGVEAWMISFVWNDGTEEERQQRRDADLLEEALAPRCHYAIGMHRCTREPGHVGKCAYEGLVSMNVSNQAHRDAKGQRMNLAAMWKLHEHGEGRTLVAAIAEMNSVTGRRYKYTRVWEWIKGRAPVPTAARGYMLRRALPTILKCVAVRLKPRELRDLEEMLS